MEEALWNSSYTEPTSSLTSPDGFLHVFQYRFEPIHGYLSLVVCVFGIIANILNIVVLTRSVPFVECIYFFVCHFPLIG